MRFRLTRAVARGDRGCAVPIKLLVVFILLALNTVFHVKSLADGDPFAGTSTYVALALNLSLVVGLIRGSEIARTFARVVGALFLLGGVLLLFRVGPALGMLGGSIYFYLVIAAPIVYGGYLLWCMGQDDVKAWLYRRAFGRFDGA